jgi:beta-phosphoglucomutase
LSADHKGVLWDMDGVLVDTGDCHYRAWAQALHEHELSFDYEFFRRTFGMNNAGILETLLGRKPDPKLLASISDRKEQLFRDMARQNTHTLPGVRDWLEKLGVMGWKQSVASSAPQANIDVLIDALELRDYFDLIASGADMPGKPDPTLFLQVARAMGVPVHRCVVVEDAIPGIQAALRARMRCIAVTTTNPAESLLQADLVVDSLTELPPDAFERLLEKT